MGNERLSRRALFGRFRARATESAIETLDAIIPEPTPRLILHTDRCFTFRGPECGACAGLCPDDAQGALTFRLNKPVIDPAICTGCGECVPACPTIPKSLEIELPRQE